MAKVKKKNDSNSKFWTYFFLIVFVAIMLMFFNPLLGFTFEIVVFLGIALKYLFKMDKTEEDYIKTPWFYELSKVLILFTLVVSILVFYLTQFNQNLLNHLLEQTYIQKFVLQLITVCFIAAPIGTIIAGFKSIKEKESLTLSASHNHRRVFGDAAVVEGVRYIIIGTAWLLGTIFVFSQLIMYVM